MNELERLEQIASDEGINVDYIPFHSHRIKGLCCGESIAIHDAIPTMAEKSCVLAEELGHYHTSSGNILDLSDVRNRKQEYRARLYGFDLRIGLIGIVRAYEYGCRNRFEIAEYLDVTEEYLDEALTCYRQRYGVFTTVDNYVIYFIPSLIVYKTVNDDYSP